MTATTTNPIATEADVIIKDIENILVPLIEKELQALDPPLALPVIQQIVNAFEQAAANELTAYFEQYVTFKIIDTQVAAEQTDMSQALKNLVSAEASGDPNAIQTAIQAYAHAQSALVNDDGSAIPH